METTTVTATGQRSWNWPCLHLESADTVTLRIGWLEDDGSVFALPTVDTAGDTVVLEYDAAEGASSATVTSVDATTDGNYVVVEEFDPSELAGVYRGVVRFKDSEGVSRRSLNVILSVKSNEFDDVRDAVTLNDVRMLLYDRLGAENEIIEGDQEFPDRLLFEGVRATVRQWNDSDASPNSHTTQNFADRNMLIIGAAGWALRSYRTLLARISVQAQGQISPEASRLRAYAEMGNELYNQYIIWMTERMRHEDANEGWGFI